MREAKIAKRTSSSTTASTSAYHSCQSSTSTGTDLPPSPEDRPRDQYDSEIGRPDYSNSNDELNLSKSLTTGLLWSVFI